MTAPFRATAPSRVWPRRAARALLALWLGALALLRPLDPFGDHGLANVVTELGLLVTALVVLLVYLLRADVAPRRRLRVSGVLAVTLALLFVCVRVRGVSGELVPVFAWRWSAAHTLVSGRAPAAERSVDLATTTPDDYPAFLGFGRAALVAAPALARDWSAQPPRLLWRAPIGAGWSAFALVNGWAVTLEQDERGECVSAFSAADGARAWSTPIDDAFTHVLGGDGPRATPAIAGGRVYAVGAWGKCVCLDGASGALLWAHDLVAEAGATRAEEHARLDYGRANSPLVAQGLVIVPAGGDAGLVAFDAVTGARRWASPVRQPSYSSPVLATLAGVAQILIVNEDSLTGHDPSDGRILWEEPWPGRSSGDASVSQAVALEPARVFVSKGYGGGALLLELVRGADGALVPHELWRDRRILRTKFTNVVVRAGFVYGLDDGLLECVELASGTRRWKDGRYGHGQLLGAGELLLVCGEDGEVALRGFDPQGGVELGRFQALAGKCWANPALARGVLFVRNAEECAAWELPRAP